MATVTASGTGTAGARPVGAGTARTGTGVPAPGQLVTVRNRIWVASDMDDHEATFKRILDDELFSQAPIGLYTDRIYRKARSPC